MRSRDIAVISMYSALAVGLRLCKHMIVGSFQFINFSLAISALTLILGLRFRYSIAIGVLSILLSDLVLGAGPWTISNMLSLALALTLILPIRNESNTLIIGTTVFISEFLYDLISSFIGYLWFLGSNGVYEAFYLSIIGLFIPAGGGGLLLVGPTTELTTALTVVFLLKPLNRLGVILYER